MARNLPNMNISNAGIKPASAHVNLNDPLFAHLQRHGVGTQELNAGHNTSGPKRPMTDGNPKTKDNGHGGKAHFIQRAIKHPGAERKAAAAAGMSTHEYMEKHEHDPGTAGRRARLGLTLEKMHGGK